MYVIRERAEDGQNTSLCSLDRPLVYIHGGGVTMSDKLKLLNFK